jgi:hypothetical protein
MPEDVQDPERAKVQTEPEFLILLILLQKSLASCR